MIIRDKDGREVARLVHEKGKAPIIRATEGLTTDEIPIALFGFKDREVTVQRFHYWLSTRVMPKERDNLDWFLAQIGLTEYNVLDICKKTKAVSIQDWFWVDFDN